MRVTFASKALEDAYRRSDIAARRWGVIVARKYIQRVEILIAARDLRDLEVPRSLRLHPLKGSLSGQYAITLTERWRLIFTFDPQSGACQIEEVSNHYDD